MKKLRYIKDPDHVDAKVSVEGTYSEEKLTVLELLESLRGENRPKDDFFRRVAIRNERYFHNLNVEEESTGDVDGQQSVWDATGTSRNYLRNMVQTWASRLNEDRPIIKAYGQHPSGRDVTAAKLADNILQDFHWREGLDAKLWEAAVYVQLHGKVGFKVTWDTSAGRNLRAPQVDEDTLRPVLDQDGLPVYEDLGPEGDVAFDVVTIFDYWYFGAEHAHDADGVVFQSWVSESQAKAALKKEHGRVMPVQSEEFTSPVGDTKRGVRVEELWIRPGTIVKDGLFALIIGGHVAYASSYPYEHGQLPVSEWKINPVRGTSQATTHVTDSLHIQRLINELEKAKVETVTKTGVPRLVGISEIVDSLERGVHTITVDDIQQAQQGARYLEPPKPAELVFGQQQEAVDGMHDIFGLNEVLVGKDSVKSGTSAKQIAYLSRLDSMKMSGAVRNFEVAYLRSSRQVLMITKQNVRNERLVRLAGETPMSGLMVQAFTGADLQGADIHLEPNSGMDKFRAQADAEAKEDLQMGAADPAEAAERAETGLGESMGEASERNRAAQMVVAVLQGQQVQPDQTINPMAAIDVINKSIGVNPQADPMLAKLLAFYRQMMSQQAAQTQQGGGGPQKPKPKSNVKPPERPDPLVERGRPA